MPLGTTIFKYVEMFSQDRATLPSSACRPPREVNCIISFEELMMSVKFAEQRPSMVPAYCGGDIGTVP